MIVSETPSPGRRPQGRCPQTMLYRHCRPLDWLKGLPHHRGSPFTIVCLYVDLRGYPQLILISVKHRLNYLPQVTFHLMRRRADKEMWINIFI